MVRGRKASDKPIQESQRSKSAKSSADGGNGLPTFAKPTESSRAKITAASGSLTQTQKLPAKEPKHPAFRPPGISKEPEVANKKIVSAKGPHNKTEGLDTSAITACTSARKFQTPTRESDYTPQQLKAMDDYEDAEAEECIRQANWATHEEQLSEDWQDVAGSPVTSHEEDDYEVINVDDDTVQGEKPRKAVNSVPTPIQK